MLEEAELPPDGTLGHFFFFRTKCVEGKESLCPTGLLASFFFLLNFYLVRFSGIAMFCLMDPTECEMSCSSRTIFSWETRITLSLEPAPGGEKEKTNVVGKLVLHKSTIIKLTNSSYSTCNTTMVVPKLSHIVIF